MIQTLRSTLVLASLVASVATASAEPVPGPDRRATFEKLRVACGEDHARFCADVRPGGGRILQCFGAHAADLTPACRAALLSARESRAVVPGTEAK